MKYCLATFWVCCEKLSDINSYQENRMLEIRAAIALEICEIEDFSVCD